MGNMKSFKKFIEILPALLSRIKIPARLIFIIVGLFSTCWFLIRVIPKPSRAEYPCMKAAYPVMSGFVIYIVGLTTAFFAFRWSKISFINAKYSASILLFVLALFTVILTLTNDSIPVYANSKLLLGPNQPVGAARGINPGRVVWIWDPKATNENCTNQFGDGWFMDKNTDLSAVVKMVDESVMKLTDKNNLKDAWESLFKYFNQTHGKGNIGYKDGEKIFIRTNQVSASDNTIDVDYSVKNTTRYGMAETSPQVVLAILRHLVNVCGIKQENISLGDPMKHMYKHFYDMLHNEFPNVTYLDVKGTLGRTVPASDIKPSIYYSDRGQILKDNGTTGNPFTADYLPKVITQSDYLIVIPAMKAHMRAGVTLCGKIHFGSNLVGSATHLHGGLVAPDKTPARTGYGLYRVQVDLMGHKDLGGKTVLFLLDALWSGSEANDPPRKFKMAPFNNDWTSSVFASQDQVALESVGFDFLKTEFTSDNPYGSYPQYNGADDHILQAADSTYWPKNFIYDPEKDGTQIHSLGVCEHWNNSAEKLYSRNLKTGNGIELIYINKSSAALYNQTVEISTGFELYQNYPNPFNPSTTIKYSVSRPSNVTLMIYDCLGKCIATLADEFRQPGVYSAHFSVSNSTLSSGIYYCKLSAGNYTKTSKMILIK